VGTPIGLYPFRLWNDDIALNVTWSYTPFAGPVISPCAMSAFWIWITRAGAMSDTIRFAGLGATGASMSSPSMYVAPPPAITAVGRTTGDDVATPLRESRDEGRFGAYFSSSSFFPRFVVVTRFAERVSFFVTFRLRDFAVRESAFVGFFPFFDDLADAAREFFFVGFFFDDFFVSFFAVVFFGAAGFFDFAVAGATAMPTARISATHKERARNTIGFLDFARIGDQKMRGLCADDSGARQV
jgi:hypothetical protein